MTIMDQHSGRDKQAAVAATQMTLAAPVILVFVSVRKVMGYANAAGHIALMALRPVVFVTQRRPLFFPPKPDGEE